MAVFLFTDIEGSTKKWEKYPESMKKVLARHDKIIKEKIDRFGGCIIKHTGDGVFAVFDNGEPLQSAFEIQKQFAKENWGEIGELRIRIGLHAGHVEKRGDDYFGPVINRTARLMAVAWGGQIILTPEVASVTELPTDASIKDVGVHLLKDLCEPQQIYQLVHPDLTLQEFPPLRSLSAHPQNLPVQTTPFLGRRDELTEVIGLLDNPQCRLLTIVGLGGMGKTRLAIHAAAEKVESFSHGVYFIPLAPLSSVDFLISTIAEALRFSFYSRDDEKIQLLNYLREKEILLIMDNFEHLVEGAGVVSEILNAAPKVKILVTSREVLNFRGEWIIKIKGMEVPEGERIDIENYSAVQLFLYHAQRVQGDVVLSDEDKRCLIRICQLVGGMPLGIEIASSWLRSLSYKEIVYEIERSLDFLATSMRDIPERHRSLRAVFEYSWDLITDEEKVVFKKLSVFRGGAERNAVERIVEAALPTLSSLVDKSLLRKDRSGRYEMLDVIRHYAEEKLKMDKKEEKKIKDLHCVFYADFLHQREPLLSGKTQKQILEEIGVEIENIRASWNWAIERGKEALIEKLMGSLYLFHEMRSWFREGEEILKKAVERMRENKRTSVRKKSQRILGRLLGYLSKFVFYLGQCEKARQIVQESLSLGKSVNDRKGVAFSQNVLGTIAWSLGNYLDAQKQYQKSLEIYKKSNDETGMAATLLLLGITYEESGEYKEAKKWYQESLRIHKKIGNKRGIASAVNSLGIIADVLGEYKEAKKLYKESLDIYKEIGDRKGTKAALTNLGVVTCLLKNYNEAENFLEESLAISKDIGDRRGIGDSYLNLGVVAQTVEQHTEAKRFYQESLVIYREIGNRKGIAYSLISLGGISFALEEYQESLEYYKEALEIAVDILSVPRIIHALVGIAELWQIMDKEKQAIELVSFILNNPACEKEIKDRAEELVPKLKSAVTHKAFVAAQKRGKAGKLEKIVKQIIQEKRS